MISLIVAHDQNLLIGADNELPWHIPEDLAYFKKMTMGKAMVMGRKTYESIGRPLPGRETIIVTRNEFFSEEGVVVVHDLNEAIEKAKEYADEVMIIGGAEIFRIALDIADRLYITLILKQYKGDVFFPSYGDEWIRVSSSEEVISKDGTRFSYLVYDRK